MKAIEKSLDFALKAHGNQQYGILPYSVHLVSVMRHFTDPVLQFVAVLHDVLEDTDVSEETLRTHFEKDIVDAVVVLTKYPNEYYLDEYIPRVSKNRLARQVKIADLQENLWFCENLRDESKYISLAKKYRKALHILGEG